MRTGRTVTVFRKLEDPPLGADTPPKIWSRHPPRKFGADTHTHPPPENLEQTHTPPPKIWSRPPHRKFGADPPRKFGADTPPREQNDRQV